MGRAGKSLLLYKRCWHGYDVKINKKLRIRPLKNYKNSTFICLDMIFEKNSLNSIDWVLENVYFLPETRVRKFLQNEISHTSVETRVRKLFRKLTFAGHSRYWEFPKNKIVGSSQLDFRNSLKIQFWPALCIEKSAKLFIHCHSCDLHNFYEKITFMCRVSGIWHFWEWFYMIGGYLYKIRTVTLFALESFW